jgi:hypothetical protein
MGFTVCKNKEKTPGNSDSFHCGDVLRYSRIGSYLRKSPKKHVTLCTCFKLSQMVLEASVETLLACGIGGKKHVRDGVFRPHAPTKKCENSTAFELSLVGGSTEKALCALLLVSHIFVRRQVSRTFLKSLQGLVRAPGQASSKQPLLRR